MKPFDAPGQIGLCLAIGTFGAVVATALGLPAAPLIGASLATSAAAWGGVRLAMDMRLRNAAFLVIGLSLGSGFRSEIVDELGQWAFSVAILWAAVVAILLVNRLMLTRLWKMTPITATLATSPGSLALAVSLAVEGRGDATTVVVMQSMRLLILAAGLPLIVAALGASPGAGGATDHFGLVAFLGLAAAGAGIALVFERWRFPAAFLVGGMIASALFHVTGLVHGLPPQWLLFAGFTVTGSVLGSRFTGIRPRAILGLSGATAVTVLLAGFVSAAFAGVTSVLTGLPFGQVWVAYAPGGVEAMAAIGIALGFDPAYVALHHLCRIGFLLVLIPVLARERPERR